MARPIGIRLFTGPTLKGFLDDLDGNLHVACLKHLSKERDLTQRELIAKLREKFNTVPLTLQLVESVAVSPCLSTYKDRDGCERWGHLAWANVIYGGSKLLLRTSPAPNFRARYVGRIKKDEVRLFNHVPDLDLTRFSAEVEAELDRTREVLRGFEARAWEIDRFLSERVETFVRCF